MPREQILYKILKLDSTFICQNNLNIENYSIRQAYEDGNLVSAGDNIAFTQIRRIRGDKRGYKQVFQDAMFLQQCIKNEKKQGRQKEASILRQKLFKDLFVQDVICVQSKTKQEYRQLARAGFFVNGKRYVRGSASAGQIRHECVYFFCDEIYPELYKRLMCDLNNRITEINIAKLSAYFSLSTSSVLWVETPRVCVIKDFFTTLKNQNIDWIINTDDGKKNVEEKITDITMNSCDGQGLISPEMAAKWSKQMGLDYISSSYVVRMVFTKGNLVPFDFKAYAHKNNINTITDRWGFEHNVDEIDVLLSESQFKMYKYYKSWEDFKQYTDRYDIQWGVSRYNRKYDSEYVLANYQIIQVLDINKKDIQELTQPTIDWIQKICSGDELYALLYSMGGFSQDFQIEYNDIYSRAQSLAMKAVVKNKDFLKDSYVQKRIYRNIVESINKAKIGKIWVRGNYSFMISDPIAQCRSALGLDPTGEIPPEHIYSKFWNDRKPYNSEIVLCRSPLLDKHEVNHCTLYQSVQSNEWYKWIQSGIIYSIYDLSTLRHSDSDFDGDLVLSSDNEVFLKGSMKDTTNPITYDKQGVPSHKICHRNFVETDIRGFGTKVGTYSNYSTIIEAMRPNFMQPGQERQQEELLLRKKLLREINGQEIDRIKGVDAKGPDKEAWLKYWKIDPEDSPQIKEQKYYHNSLLLKKKPYFFRYLYSELNDRLKKYEKAYDEASKCIFGLKMKKLLLKNPKTKSEITLVKRYFKFMPVLNTNCTMNILCRMVEDTDFDIKYNRNCKSMLPYYDLSTFNVDESILKKISELYVQFCDRNCLFSMNLKYLFDDRKIETEEELTDMRFQISDIIQDQIKTEFEQIDIDPMTALTYIKIISNQYSKFNWDFAWQIVGDGILDCIESKQAYAAVEDPNGEEFLGIKYSLKEIPNFIKEKIINQDTLIV